MRGGAHAHDDYTLHKDTEDWLLCATLQGPGKALMPSPSSSQPVLHPLLPTCWASSRVGARTRPMGPSPGRSGGWARQWLIMGMAKDAVLPLPVSAHPRMSLPASAMGMPCVWMGVGVSYLCSLMSWMMFGCRFCMSEQEGWQHG
eukprot:scaffold27299_cov19-Tisochrysis_lutea.AAC.1